MPRRPYIDTDTAHVRVRPEQYEAIEAAKPRRSADVVEEWHHAWRSEQLRKQTEEVLSDSE